MNQNQNQNYYYFVEVRNDFSPYGKDNYFVYKMQEDDNHSLVTLIDEVETGESFIVAKNLIIKAIKRSV